MAWWIDVGCVASDGSNLSRGASTAIRSSSKKSGNLAETGAGVVAAGDLAVLTVRTHARDRKAGRRACRQPFSGESQPCLRLLRVASGIHAKAQHLLRKAS